MGAAAASAVATTALPSPAAARSNPALLLVFFQVAQAVAISAPVLPLMSDSVSVCPATANKGEAVLVPATIATAGALPGVPLKLTNRPAAPPSTKLPETDTGLAPARTIATSASSYS